MLLLDMQTQSLFIIKKFISAATEVDLLVDIVSRSHRRRLRYHKSGLVVLRMLVLAVLLGFTVCFLFDEFVLYFAIDFILPFGLFSCFLSC